MGASTRIQRAQLGAVAGCRKSLGLNEVISHLEHSPAFWRPGARYIDKSTLLLPLSRRERGITFHVYESKSGKTYLALGTVLV